MEKTPTDVKTVKNDSSESASEGKSPVTGILLPKKGLPQNNAVGDNGLVKKEKTIGGEKAEVQEKPSTPENVPSSAKSKNRTFRLLIVLILLLLVISTILFSVFYFKKNFTPKAILIKSLQNFKNGKYVKYDTDVKMTFSYANKDEKINIGDMEVYSLLSKNTSDKYEIKLSGEHNWRDASPSGNFILTWNIDDRKVFAVDSKYTGFDLSYKVNPYEYEGMVGTELKDNYSVMDLSDVLKRILSESAYNDLFNLHEDDIDLEITETYPDDTIDSEKSYHYKIKLNLKGETGELLAGVDTGDLDIWIAKRGLVLKKIKTGMEIKNIGTEGNNMIINVESRFTY